MKQFIINPKDNKRYSIYTKKGINILKKYVNQYISTYGGVNNDNDDYEEKGFLSGGSKSEVAEDLKPKTTVLLIDNLNEDNEENINTLKEVVELSDEIFKGEHKSAEPYKPKYEFKEWVNRFNGVDENKSLGNGVLVITKNNDEISAFIMGYSVNNKIYPGLNDGEYMHVWMAGTNPHFRKQGLMMECFGKIEEYTQSNSKFIGLSLNTNPIKYKGMFYLATKKLNLKVYKTEEDNGKVFLKKEY